MAAQQKSADELVNRMIQLAESKYNCSQIMMVLALEQEGRETRSLSGPCPVWVTAAAFSRKPAAL